MVFILRQSFLVLLFLVSTSVGAANLEISNDRKIGIGFSLGVFGGFGLSAIDLNRFNEYAVTNRSYGYDINGPDSFAGADTHFHVRRFFKKQLGGFYYGAFIHRTTLEGRLKNRYKTAKQTKHGLGLEVGYTSYRKLKKRRLNLFWGSGIGVSHYIGVKETGIFEEPDLENDSDIGLFIDIIRVGAVF